MLQKFRYLQYILNVGYYNTVFIILVLHWALKITRILFTVSPVVRAVVWLTCPAQSNITMFIDGVALTVYETRSVLYNQQE